ncbi:MAG TPA: hypothetical protein VF746_03470 [Longimicrobium sp.]|jgi:hypothetical protein
MSEKNPETQNTTEATELTDESVEQVSGGIIDGGCIGPFPPTFPEGNSTF